MRVGQSITDQLSVTPFSSAFVSSNPRGGTQVPGLTLEDVGNPSMTLMVALSSVANGVLSNLDGGTYNVLTGIYAVTGTAAVTTALDGLVFTPTISDAPLGSTKTTTFTIVVNDGIVPPVSDSVVMTQA
jgi:hypothetical protein